MVFLKSYSLFLAVTVYRDPPKAVLIETGGRLLLTCMIILSHEGTFLGDKKLLR